MADKTITIDLSAPTRLVDVPALAGAFFAWWGREIASLVPGWFSGKSAARPRTRLTAGSALWRIEAADGSRAVIIDPSAGDHAVAEQIMREGGQFELKGLDVLLPRGDALIRRLELTLMNDRDLRAALELQLDRLSPFTANTARIAYRRAGQPTDAGNVAVEVAIVPNVRVAPLEQRLRALGLKPVAIDVEGPTGGPAGFDLRKPETSEERRRRGTRTLALALAAVVVWFAAFNAWSTAAENEAAAWQARIAELRPAAERTADLRRRVEALTRPFAIANAHDPADTLSVLMELTKVLPDDARILDLRLDGTKLNLVGLSPSAPALIAQLEASKRFKNVKFAAPLMRHAGGKNDRFEIALDLEGKGAP